MPGKRLPLAERLRARVVVDKQTGCHLWTGMTLEGGYGQISRGRKSEGMVTTHRAAWELAYGPIPDDLWVLHRCDVPNCVNPEHLFLGTHDDNMRDMVSKGRGRNASKEKTHCPRGHPYSPENTYVCLSYATPRRFCRTCMREAGRLYAQRRRDLAKVDAHVRG